MIEKLTLENFRGFEHHEIPFRATTVLVGANNAGKSTVLEALRLVALFAERFRRGTGPFVPVPAWLNHLAAFDGIAPAVRGLPGDGFEASLFYGYGNPPAILTASFSSGASVTVFIGPEAQVHGVARKSDGAPVTRVHSGTTLGLTPIAVQPQVAPLLRDEPIRQPDTIRRGVGSYLAPQHFRNQLWLFDDAWDSFVAMAEDTWPGLQVIELEGDPLHPEQPLQLRLRDGGFVGDVSLMGHGLQMWLQVIWFLARTAGDATVVLDEPDVYMHPDLQRRLLGLLRDRFAQLVIATHSVEIISDVDPSSILSIDRNQTSSRFVTSLPGLQEVLDGIGTIQNVQVTRLMRASSFYLVEGKDVKLLRVLQATFAPTAVPIDLVPNARLGGRGGWSSGVPSRLPTTNAEGGVIKSFAILDRDYFPEEEITERYAEARQWKIQLRVLARKEIENYLLVPEAISRLIARDSTQGTPPDSESVSVQIDAIVDELKEEPVLDSMATIILSRDKKGGLPKAMKAARAALSARWADRAARWSTAPGKEVISKLSAWSQTNYGASFGPETIARELTKNEIDPEIIEVITAIVDARQFRAPFAMPK